MKTSVASMYHSRSSPVVSRSNTSAGNGLPWSSCGAASASVREATFKPERLQFAADFPRPLDVTRRDEQPQPGKRTPQP